MPKRMQVEELYKEIHEGKPLTIIDVRYDLKDETYGQRAYLEGHIPGAFFLDVKRDLASPAKKHGGENPLPDLQKLARKLSQLGIDPQAKVIIYDDENDMYAARAWWILRYGGLVNVYILEGGLRSWVKKGYQLSQEEVKRKPKEIKLQANEDLVLHIEQLKEKIKQKTSILIDSRSRERYEGKVEPLYKKAGHIPGAVNYYYGDLYRENGRFKSQEELLAHFSTLDRDEEIIVSCGSGISACANIFALESLGYKNVKLYPGSFSDWISYDHNPVVQGKK